MIGERMTRLMRAAAEDAAAGVAPLSHDFLVAHDVTLDEAYELSDWISRSLHSTLELDKTASGQRLLAMHVADHLMRKAVARDGD